MESSPPKYHLLSNRDTPLYSSRISSLACLLGAIRGRAVVALNDITTGVVLARWGHSQWAITCSGDIYTASAVSIFRMWQMGIGAWLDRRNFWYLQVQGRGYRVEGKERHLSVSYPIEEIRRNARKDKRKRSSSSNGQTSRRNSHVGARVTR